MKLTKSSKRGRPGPRARENREVEAKFILDGPGDFDRVVEELKALGYRLGPGREVVQHDTYFDTPDFKLLKGSMSFRLRRIGRKRTVTFKRGRPKRGMADRLELETEVSLAQARRLAALELDTPPVTEVAKAVGSVSLIPVLEVENHRRTFGLARDGRLQFELARDLGLFWGGGRSIRFGEIEIEDKDDCPSGLAVVRSHLLQRLYLAPAVSAKYERGVAKTSAAVSQCGDWQIHRRQCAC